jgi:hypothetical protein
MTGRRWIEGCGFPKERLLGFFGLVAATKKTSIELTAFLSVRLALTGKCLSPRR